ncbi:MAG: TetR/AcrR family transcriptional regulator [Gammaproteobacteria bacterium]|nr:TetR/AcrR family transcriptional regulator [Gammaproteobacteria bacterium]
MPSKSERTRQTIVDAANRLIYRKGYHRTSFSDIVDETDVPRGNIYYYFKTKDELLHAVIEQRLATTSTMLSDWEQKLATPIERLERFVQIMYDSTPALLRSGCPMGTLNCELGKDGGVMRQEAKQLVDLFQQWSARQFDAMGYSTESRELSLQLLARAQGVISIAHVYQEPGFLQREADEIKRWLHQLEQYA